MAYRRPIAGNARTGGFIPAYIKFDEAVDIYFLEIALRVKAYDRHP